jgi:formate hydrogenlyase subunit 6/NADH:ubiquinone oxidoreductase subunit I
MPDKGRNEACVADALAGLDKLEASSDGNKDDEVERADGERRRKKKKSERKKRNVWLWIKQE